MTVTLVERGRATARLSARCVDALRRDLAAVVAVTPTARRHVYRLAAGGHVGEFTAGGTAFTIAPKYPLTFLGGPGRDVAGDITASLARRFAAELRALLAAGLLRGYREQASESPTVRGRIDFARLMRNPGGPVPVVADEFTLDTPLNAIPKAALLSLLAGDLPPNLRGELASLLPAFDAVVTPAPPPARWPDPAAEPRTARYAASHATARLILANVGTTRLHNLEAIFEQELTARLAGPRVIAQEPLPLTSPGGLRTLRPDFTVRDPAGRPLTVWDAKWKTLARTGPADDDLHQALGYAAALGVRACGLIYPGRSGRVRTWAAQSGVTVTAVTLPVTGDPAAFDAAAARLRRRLLKKEA